jgi:hypothetical protein
MNKKRISEYSQTDKDRVCDVVHRIAYGYDDDCYACYSPSVAAKIRPLVKRIVDSAIAKSLPQDGISLMALARAILHEEYLTEYSAVIWYLTDKHGISEHEVNNLARYERDNQTDAQWLYWHSDDVKAFLRAANIKNHDIISFWDTNGIACLTIKQV